jgi:hypothetical protein
VLLYQIICLRNTPPETAEEQAKCFKARAVCWRIAEAMGTDGARRARPRSERFDAPAGTP